MSELSCRKALDNILSYAPAKTLQEIQQELGLSNILRLSANENTMGPSPLALKAIEEGLKGVYLYPDGLCTELRRKLAYTYNLKEEELIFGNGSFELINLVAQGFINPGDESIIPTPSFGWYKVVTLAMDGVPVEIPLENHSINLKEVKDRISSRTKVIWLCNPNNPTGTIFGKEELIDFLDSIPKNILVVLDEAYYEFATNEAYPQTASLVDKYSNIIVLRTFSKVYGLAALRIGYGIADKKLLGELNKIRLPINVNGLAQAAAIASLEDQNFRGACVSNNNKGKEFFYKEFDEIGLEYIPTETNFIMVNVEEDSVKISNKILKNGIAVRAGVEYNMPTWLRITIGKPEENKLVVEELKAAIKNFERVI
ncbi:MULTISPECIES: histidinol-phosphate transaminase [Clostridium]|jgi:histidinol-phosphate aminotransferase|uniref:histidinol-phosphate transaminase n=1 Tax=Clostridium TaxID=1485 RepID=UPI000288531B|nr:MULTISPECIES: histidinol-phosphate transaminase [Clostridium]MDF2503093.1 histidinol-phosphate aminotransferase [Clostridium sp.]